MPMARREKEPILMARERANLHDQGRERETVDGHDQERERQSMAMTRRERDSGWP